MNLILGTVSPSSSKAESPDHNISEQGLCNVGVVGYVGDLERTQYSTIASSSGTQSADSQSFT